MHRNHRRRTRRDRALSVLMGALLATGIAGVASSAPETSLALPIVDVTRSAIEHASRGAAPAAPADASEQAPPAAPPEGVAPAAEPAPAAPAAPELPPFLPMFANGAEREQALFVSGQGWGNGHLPPEALSEPLPGCRMIIAAADRFREMLAFAQAAGHTFRINDCYRDFFGQQAVRWEWCVKGACQNAAVPGYSNHGTGVAIDVGLPDRQLTPGDAAFAWLTEHGPRFGFRQPDWALPGGPVPEPWHWEYFGPVERRW